MRAAPAFRRIPPPPALFIVSDLHGDADAFEAALAAAPSDALIVSLGDVVDRGPDAPRCAARLLTLLEAGRAVFIAGNHDVAFADALDGRRAPTPRRAEALAHFAAYDRSLAARFRAAVRAAPLCVRIGAVAAAHAAWRPEMERSADWSSALRETALYGDRRIAPGKRRPEISYRWTDDAPAGTTIFVGHDVRSEAEPLVIENAAGGRTVFLDLGCGKAGALGCALARDGEIRFSRIESRIAHVHAGA